MKDQTVKLSGYAKDRFLARFLASEPGLTGDVLARLTDRSKAAFSSLRVRKALLAPPRRVPGPGKTAGQTVPPSPPKPEPPSKPQPQSQPAEAVEFDAYAIGLVPVFQREGREGLLAKLADVGRLDHLRQMAKAQQIVLPQALRTGDAPIDEVCAAIADAVAKRIADRRAAAG